MRTFGFFSGTAGSFYGELDSSGDSVRPLTKPFWLGDEQTDTTAIPLAQLKVGIPVAPSKIVAVGLNYHDHARERNKQAPKSPLTWLEAPTSLLASGGTIELPYLDHRIDYEAELCIVIGKRAKNVAAKNAHEYIFGYTAANDVTDRTIQDSEGQNARGKSFDTFTPVGPFVYTDVDVSDIPVVLELNGVIRQNGRTGEMIFKPAEVVEFITKCTTLLPGDIIITGTPAGVGNLKPGDQVVVKIGAFHPLTAQVKAA
jgi:2-keto-4-pentenoate hydratase/2-oxohepta-3-ene-1,7-dioic acid hydratase in catechol pathway